MAPDRAINGSRQVRDRGLCGRREGLEIGVAANRHYHSVVASEVVPVRQ